MSFIVLIMICFSFIFICPKYLKICVNMKSANILSTKWDNMVNVVFNTRFLRNSISFLVNQSNFFKICPFRGSSFNKKFSFFVSGNNHVLVLFFVILPPFFYFVRIFVIKISAIFYPFLFIKKIIFFSFIFSSLSVFSVFFMVCFLSVLSAILVDAFSASFPIYTSNRKMPISAWDSSKIGFEPVFDCIFPRNLIWHGSNYTTKLSIMKGKKP